MGYKVHAAALIFPLEEDTLDALSEDIKRNGLIDPITILDGGLTDGRRDQGC